MSTTFAALGVPEDLVAVLSERGIETPFPIQSAVLADALGGFDVTGRAPTGSGKTLAFGLAVATRVSGSRPRRPRALILAPTRELAEQIRRELAPLLEARGRRTATIYGGVSYLPQRKALARGVDVVVACPGRLEDLIQQGDIDLGDVDIVVLDEADRMADMGFLPAVKRILDATRPERQTLLFSATLDGDVDVVVKRYQNNPRRHEVAGEKADSGDVRHLFWHAPRADRVGITAQLVDKHESSVVFVRTRHGADRLMKQLGQYGVKAATIHGSRSQAQRDRALREFTEGKVAALVATDVAARGIHVDDVGCVIHFDPPADAKDYMHRSGRTGRAGADGVVVSLAEEGVENQIRAIQRRLGLNQTLGTADIDAIAASEPVSPEIQQHMPEAGPRSGGRNNQNRSGGNSRPRNRSNTRAQVARGASPRRSHVSG